MTTPWTGRWVADRFGVTLSGALLSFETSTFPSGWRRDITNLPMDAREAYAAAIRVVLWWIMGASIVALIIALLIPSRQLQDSPKPVEPQRED